MKRTLLAPALVAGVVVVFWLASALLPIPWGLPRTPQALVENTVLDPYDTPLLQGYKAYRDAAISNDLDALAQVAATADGYLAYRASLTLARSYELDPAARLEHYLRAEQLRIDEPLARSENRSFYLEIGAVAEAAGDIEQAVAAFEKALPESAAAQALARLVDDPYRLANHYFRNNLHSRAIQALDGRSAPSIEGPAYQRLAEYHKMLDAYERWLAESPDNLDARYGVAWAHFYLGNNAEARSRFEALPGADALYARALIARREGKLDEAVSLMRQNGQGSRLWMATGWLEAEGMYEEALPIYLQLAAIDSVYADDAAYRAITLAQRLGDAGAAAQARQLLQDDSFFALRMGAPLPGPEQDTLPEVEVEAVELAWELARVSDMEAAVGELVLALRDAEDEATTVEIAEALQLLGEFRQSQRAVQPYMSAGSRELRTWRAAYPRAFPEIVESEAARHDVEPELIWAVMRQESAFYPRAVSVSNAGGLMQVLPSTWDWLAELQGEEPGDRFDPADNIRYGSFYLRWLLNYHDEDLELVIPSYNRGQGYIRRLLEADYVAGDKDEFFREIDALETREYMQVVTLNYHIYQALYSDGIRAELDTESSDLTPN